MESQSRRSKTTSGGKPEPHPECISDAKGYIARPRYHVSLEGTSVCACAFFLRQRALQLKCNYSGPENGKPVRRGRIWKISYHRFSGGNSGFSGGKCNVNSTSPGDLRGQTPKVVQEITGAVLGLMPHAHLPPFFSYKTTWPCEGPAQSNLNPSCCRSSGVAPQPGTRHSSLPLGHWPK